MKSSLPSIDIQLKWMIKCQIWNISTSLKDITDSVMLFEEKFRWPILSFCCRIELLIDMLIKKLFFLLFEIDFDDINKKEDIFDELFFSSNILNLNTKINLLINLLERFERCQFWFDSSNNGVKKFKDELDKYRKIRNIFAHSQVEPKVNTKNKVIDIYIKFNWIETKVDEQYIETKILNLEFINKLLLDYSNNFEIKKVNNEKLDLD